MNKATSNWQCEPCQPPQNSSNVCLVCVSPNSKAKVKIVKRGGRKVISRLRDQ